MGREKRDKGGKKGNQKEGREPTLQGPLPDRRAMEKMLADVGKLLEEQEFETMEEVNAFLEQMMASGMPTARPAETPLEKAQEVMYEAWEAEGKQRIRLARRALKISEDCADAYVLLAEEEARTPQKARELYEKGVAAGERALGKKMFEEGEGHFWGILETRPYMRAREGLAHVLWFLGKRDEAIEQMQEMLRLNPNDNQGVRYALFTWLLAEGRLEDAEQLARQYDEDIAATWSYNRALLAFRREGATPKARKRLREAFETNPHVPAFLMGERRVPRQMPPYVSFGDETEAIDYAAGGVELWSETEGALAWLRDNWQEDDQSIPSLPFDLNACVAMKKGEHLEAYDVEISGWQGRVINVDEEGDLYLLWDSQTLQQIPDELVAQMIEEGVDWTGLIVEPEAVRPAAERDDPEDWEAVARERYAEHGVDMDSIISLRDSEWTEALAYSEAEELPDLDELLSELDVPEEEQQLVWRCLAEGVEAYFGDLYGHDHGLERDFLIGERASEPYVVGYGALEVIEHAEISTRTKAAICTYALGLMNPSLDHGVPYGLLTLVGFLAAEGYLTPPMLVVSMMALQFSSFGFFRRAQWLEGATTEAVEALVDWLVEDEEMTDEQKLWVVWQISIRCDGAPHIGKALANRWLGKEEVAAEDKREVCWAWVTEEEDVGHAPVAWQLMEAYMAGDEERLEEVIRESGIDPAEAPLPLAEMTQETEGDEDDDIFAFLAGLRDFILMPAYLKRLAIPELVRYGEDLELVAETVWEAKGEYYGEAVNRGVADAIEEFHDRLSQETLRRLIERGINHGRATTRKPFYELSTRFFGDEYLAQALEDNAKSVRQWAARVKKQFDEEA